MVADFDVTHYRPIIGTVTADGEECGYRNADIAVVVFFTGLYLLQPARYFFIMVKSAAAIYGIAVFQEFSAIFLDFMFPFIVISRIGLNGFGRHNQSDFLFHWHTS